MLFGVFILLHVPVSDPWCSDIGMALRNFMRKIEYLNVSDTWTRTSIQSVPKSK